MQRKYLITKEVVNLIYDLINAPERTMSERIDKLTMMEELRKELDAAEVSPWDEYIYPWEDGSGLPKADRLAGRCVCNEEAVEEAGKEIRR